MISDESDRFNPRDPKPADAGKPSKSAKRREARQLATQALYHMQGDYWTTWNDKLRDSVVATQVMQGDVAGTWAPRDAWETTGGRIFAMNAGSGSADFR